MIIKWWRAEEPPLAQPQKGERKLRCGPVIKIYEIEGKDDDDGGELPVFSTHT